jgi:hypothetical protein
MRTRAWGLFGAGVTVPWCCLSSSILSLIGVTGLSLGALIQVEATVFPFLALAAIGLLGRAHYLLWIKHQGNRLSWILTWACTGFAAVMVGLWLWR